MSSRDDRRGPFDPPEQEPARSQPDSSPQPYEDSGDPTTTRDAPLDWWRESPRETAPQWSLLELFLITTSASLAAAAARFVPPVGLSAVLGVLFVLGWARLYLDDWEPRWALLAWRAILAAYLVSTLITLFG